MTIALHGVTMNGRMSMEFKPHPPRTLKEELRVRLELLDGSLRYALLVWHLPEGVPFDLYDFEAGPNDYMQCAGGAEGRFTCEIRTVAGDGVVRHEVLGRRGQSESGDWTTISWDQHETSVRSSEVLDVDEVEELFWSYLVDRSTPAGFTRREISA